LSRIGETLTRFLSLGSGTDLKIVVRFMTEAARWCRADGFDVMTMDVLTQVSDVAVRVEFD
jgi:hypothetical protein